MSIVIDIIWRLIEKFLFKPKPTVTEVLNEQIKTVAERADTHADDSLSNGKF